MTGSGRAGGAPRMLVSGAVLGQPMGGVRRHNQELLPRLARLLRARGGGLAVLEGRTGAACELPEPIERLRADIPAGPPLARALAETRALRRVLAEARARGVPFDLVHTAHLPAPRALGVPLTLTLHDLRALERGAPFLRRVLARAVIGQALRGAARVFTVSEQVAAALRERCALPAARLRVIGNGGDHFAPLPRAPGPDAPLLCVGHLEPRKNLALLVRALATDSALPPLLLAGAARGGEDRRLLALARELGVAQRVRLLGPFEEAELPRLYAGCAAVVIPSRVEGFCLPALEAQLASCPLAVAACGALPEVAPLAPRFAPDDAAGCAAALHSALAAPRGALELSRVAASARTWDRCAQAWLEGLLDLGHDARSREAPR